MSPNSNERPSLLYLAYEGFIWMDLASLNSALEVPQITTMNNRMEVNTVRDEFGYTFRKAIRIAPHVIDERRMDGKWLRLGCNKFLRMSRNVGELGDLRPVEFVVFCWVLSTSCYEWEKMDMYDNFRGFWSGIENEQDA